MTPAKHKTQLSVNVNKVATLRNARGKNTPDLVRITTLVLQLPVGGITVHPRPDGRHIKTQDVFDLKALLEDYPGKEYNIEGRPEPDFLKLIEKVRPQQCTLVPDSPEALTSNAGWDFVKHSQWLKNTVLRLKALKVRSSLFLDPLFMDNKQYTALHEIAPQRIELFTEHYAQSHAQHYAQSPALKEDRIKPEGQISRQPKSHPQRSPIPHRDMTNPAPKNPALKEDRGFSKPEANTPPKSLAQKGDSRALPHEGDQIGKTKENHFDKRGYEQILSLYQDCALRLTAEGINVNAGHDLNQNNLLDFLQAVPQTREVSIGQALIAQALEEGLPRTIQKHLDLIDKAFGFL